MSIKKYISFEQAEKDLWVLHTDEKYYMRLKRLYNFWNRISKKNITTGIQRIKSVGSDRKQ